MTAPIPASAHQSSVLRKRESLTARMVREVSEGIARGLYQPGDKLPSEQAFCELFDISRSVVREAISGLRAEGLIMTRHGVGAFVLPQAPQHAFRIDETELATLQEVVKVLDLRICIEVESAACAARQHSQADLQAIGDTLDVLQAGADGREPGIQADSQFHQAIARATGNRYFVEILGFLSAKLTPRLRADPFKDDEQGRTQHIRQVNEEHAAIYRAIASRDSELAQQLMREHLSHARNRLQAICDAQGTRTLLSRLEAADNLTTPSSP